VLVFRTMTVFRTRWVFHYQPASWHGSPGLKVSYGISLAICFGCALDFGPMPHTRLILQMRMRCLPGLHLLTML
jgi:hypothetical protein